MTKPAVSSHLIPSALLYYNQKKLDGSVQALIQRCEEARQRGDRPAIIAIDADIAGLPATVPHREKAIGWVYLADLAWAADEFPKARNAYKEAREVFHLSSAPEDRHNEAAAIYGQGLASHAVGNCEEAQHCYNQALVLFQAAKDFWAAEGNDRRSRSCQEICTEIERLRKLCMDSPMASMPPVSPSTATSVPITALPPTITAIKPDRGALNVPVDQFIEITFSEAMDPNSFCEDEYDIDPPIVDWGVTWDSYYKQATIQHQGFAHSEKYVVTIKKARTQGGSALMSPVTWIFTTQGRPNPTIRYTWPCEGDVDIPLEAPLIVQCSQLIQDISYTAMPSLPPPKTSRRSPDGRTVQVDFSAALTAGTAYEVAVDQVQDDKGKWIDVDQLTSAPNPWHFQTVTSRLEREEGFGNVYLVLAAILLFSLIAAGGVALQIWLGWIAAGVYVLVWGLASPLLVRMWRRTHVVFSLSAREEAIVHRAGQLRVMAGPMLTALRWPAVEKLRAIVPVQPLGFQVADSQVTNDYQQRLALAIEVRYQVFGSVKAFCSFLENCEDKDLGSKVYREKDLRATWEKNLRQIVVQEVQRRLKTVRQQDVEKGQGQLEMELVQLLNLRAYQWGIEIQGVRLTVT